MKNVLNHNAVFVSSVQKLLNLYRRNGSGNPKAIYTIHTINEILINVGDQISENSSKGLIKKYMDIITKLPDYISPTLKLEIVYGNDECMNPTYVASDHNNGPVITNPDTINYD